MALSTSALRGKRVFSSDSEDDEGTSKRSRVDESDEESETNNRINSLLKSAGLIVKDVECKHHVLKVNQDEFIKKLDKNFKMKLDFNESVELFVKEVIEILDGDDQVLVQWLQPTKTASSCKNARGPYQDSAIRLLLNVDFIQPTLSSWLLEKMALVALEESDQDDQIAAKSQGKMNGLTQPIEMNKPQLILSHLRWLNKIVKGEEMVDKILEVLDGVPTRIQQEVIVCLPEIVPDEFHAKIAMQLRDKLDDGDLGNVILDTFYQPVFEARSFGRNSQLHHEIHTFCRSQGSASHHKVCASKHWAWKRIGSADRIKGFD